MLSLDLSTNLQAFRTESANRDRTRAKLLSSICDMKGEERRAHQCAFHERVALHDFQSSRLIRRIYDDNADSGFIVVGSAAGERHDSAGRESFQVIAMFHLDPRFFGGGPLGQHLEPLWP
jgi:hypothetical protein